MLQNLHTAQKLSNQGKTIIIDSYYDKIMHSILSKEENDFIIKKTASIFHQHSDLQNMIKHFHNQREIAALKEEVEGLQKQLDDYARRSDELHRDIDIMEKVARERYGMHKEGEEVFIIED